MPLAGSALDEARTRRTDFKVCRERVATGQAGGRRRLGLLRAVPERASASRSIQDPPTVLLPQTGWQAQLVLTLPLYDGGQRTGIAHERDALRRRVARQPRRRAAPGAVRRARQLRGDAARRPGARLGARRRPPRAQGLRPGDARLPGGASTNIEVLDAARQARDADTATAAAEDLSRQARLDLLVAAGRFPGPPPPWLSRQ